MSDATNLDVGETILWRGRPDPLRYLRHRGLATYIGLGLLMLAFGTALTFSILSIPSPVRPAARPHTDFFSMPPPPTEPMFNTLLAEPWWMTAPLVVSLLLMFGMALVMLALPAWKLRQALQTRYLLTDRRAIIETGASSARHRQTFALANLPFVEFQPVTGGRGHVLFSQATPLWTKSVSKDGFIAIPEPERVERLLLQGALAAR